jgi:DnaJ-class molecular chaperone
VLADFDRLGRNGFLQQYGGSGAQKFFIHLNGKEYVINNTTGKIISPNQTTTIPNMGLTRNGHIGSLKIIFLVEFPKSLTSEQIEHLAQIL